MSELAAALVKAQTAMPAVGKDSANPHFRSKFASLDHIIEVTRPVLNKCGLSIHQFPSHNDLGAPTLVTRISHTSGESLEYAAPLFLQGQDMQKYGAALTYARRYAWSAALGIATEDDDDGNHASAPATVQETNNGASSGHTLDPHTFVWTSGKHAGKTLEGTPDNYIEWYAENGPKQDVRDLCHAYLDDLEPAFTAPPLTDDDIPF